jgi:hypothetical protein
MQQQRRCDSPLCYHLRGDELVGPVLVGVATIDPNSVRRLNGTALFDIATTSGVAMEFNGAFVDTTKLSIKN